MGQAYPTPGLHGKFYDLDMEPLVEVIRDTVGRHDTFALACQAKYYEDLGYPGHVNCTDNFNGALEPFEIAPRKGWEALNFFYNTAFDSSLQLISDEPWSRPGDYVMLRALSDLVCASSACPDDIDPVERLGGDRCPRPRLFAAEPLLGGHRPPRDRRRAAGSHAGDGVPPANDRAHQVIRRVPRLLAAPLLQQRRGDRRVLGLPGEGRGDGPEPAAEVRGAGAGRRDADAAHDHARCPQAVGRPGRLHRAVQRDGRHDRRRHRVPPGRRQLPLRRRRRVRRRLAARDRPTATTCKVWVKPSTDQLHNLAVQGPLSRETPEADRLDPAHPAEPGPSSSGSGSSSAASTPTTASRSSSRAPATPASSATRCGATRATGPRSGTRSGQAGEPYGIKPLGLEALDILRIESGLIFAGYEFDDQVDPFEAGIGFTVALANDEDFIGRDALIERKEHPQRRLVGLELEGNETAGHGDPVYVGPPARRRRHQRHPQPDAQRSIALARKAVQYADIGTEVEVGQARRPPEADPRAGGALPVLRPGQDPAPLLRTTLSCAP